MVRPYSIWVSLASFVTQETVTPVEVRLEVEILEIVGGVVSGGASVVRVETVA